MSLKMDLSDPAVRQFDKEGYVLFDNVLDSDLIGEAKEHVDWLIAKNPHLRPESLDTQLVTKDAFWVRLISDERLLDIAQKFIGPDIALFASHYISKPPFDGRPVLWHQDGSYWPLDPMDVVTLWLAVDDSLPENGCMRVIPGTQNSELMQMKPRTDVVSVLGSGMEEGSVDETKAANCVLKAGGVSVHHPNVIHGSNANFSALRRCGLTIRYIPTTTRIKMGGKQMSEYGNKSEAWCGAFLLRGSAVPGINVYNPFPAYSPEHSMRFKGCENWK